ncbi:MAG: cytochrome c-type biogenesis protein [Xanthomonadales bacterium]|nr:cytochrome c-type biogenesis protein [Xanthomonadales bacterium]
MTTARSLIVTLLLALAPAWSLADEPPEFASAEDEQRYRELLTEFRCPKCQNQALSDSDAPLAQDLRRQIAAQVREGRSDVEIQNYLVSRYSDFVLYRPPVQGNTWLLWVGPFVLLMTGAAVLVVAVRRRARSIPDANERVE